MTLQERTLVQASFEDIVPVAPFAAKIFYQRLFAIDPQMRALFPAEMAEQELQSIAMLDLAVRGLDDLPKLTHTLEHLGKLHTAYGIEDEHYAIVGAALLDTLAIIQGAAFTPAVRSAWTSVYIILSQVMKAAAQESSAA